MILKLISILIQVFVLLLPLFIIAGAFVIGSIIERRHLAQLDAAEVEFDDIILSDLKRIPTNWNVTDSSLICGQVVIANDRFKSWLAGWINLFGGRIACYETLLSRARREALVRLRREARGQDANVIWNIRIATSTIAGQRQAAGVEVLAYGTALRVDTGVSS